VAAVPDQYASLRFATASAKITSAPSSRVTMIR
jgi:hypothetical protein